MVRPERFELPTLWFEAKGSIQLSYGRVEKSLTPIDGDGHRSKARANTDSTDEYGKGKGEKQIPCGNDKQK